MSNQSPLRGHGQCSSILHTFHIPKKHNYKKHLDNDKDFKLKNIKGEHTFWRCFSISQNTCIYRVTCTENIIEKYSGHPKV